MEWLQRTGVDSLPILEAGSLTARCQRGHAPARPPGRSLPSSSLLGGSGCSLACGHVTPPSASSPVTVCLLLSSSWAFGPILIQEDLIVRSLPELHLQRLFLFQMRSHSEVPGGHIFRGATIQPKHLLISDFDPPTAGPIEYVTSALLGLLPLPEFAAPSWASGREVA